MNRKQILWSSTILLGLLPLNNVFGQSYKKVGPISYAVPFLTITPDARSGAMGDVGVALSPDAYGHAYNVGKVVMSEDEGGLGINMSPWLRDIAPDVSLYYISGFTKFGKDKDQAISGSLRYFNLGKINYRSENNDDEGNGQPYELAFDIAYSRKLSENLSLGAGIRYINSNIAAGVKSTSSGGMGYKAANAVAADIGLFYTKKMMTSEDEGSEINFGATLRNVGSRVTYSQVQKDFLPAQLAVGVAYIYIIDEYNKITGALDLVKSLVPAAERVVEAGPPVDTFYRIPREKTVVSGILSSFSDAPGMYGTTIGIGAEYWYQDQFALRGGYFHEDKDLGNRQYFAIGAGVRYSMFGLDASYLVPSGSGIARNPLSNTLRFSLLFNFNQAKYKTGKES
ncbi:MAG TPA: type IX secretion system outer membrane channel protein PorV [Edaphocola sp.]|nr:type IX secretion system outer membrane channel protein PorV [Edaphocola sp.]